MYLNESRTASMAMSKQSAGVDGAITIAGHSPFRPQTAWNRSACSVLVGKPVEGPPRWTLIITNGSSVITARPIASCFRATPGPDVPVNPTWPAKLAPIAAQKVVEAFFALGKSLLNLLKETFSLAMKLLKAVVKAAFQLAKTVVEFTKAMVEFTYK